MLDSMRRGWYSLGFKWFAHRTTLPQLAMDEQVLEFTADGSPKDLSRAIEQYAVGQGNLNAIVVPWESECATLSMAVTSQRIDGWAIEHTNLGTIELSDLGNRLTRVAVVAHAAGHADKPKLAALFSGFARGVQARFQTTP